MSYTHTVLITGGTSGLGFEAALDIARKHPEYRIVIASRTNKEDAATSINKKLGQENTIYMPLDLSTRNSVRAFVRAYESKNFPPIQALLLNAGIQFPEGIKYSDDGEEMTFAVNHVGGSLLFFLLFNHLVDGARIIVTSSGTHDPAQKSGLPDALYTNGDELARPTSKTIDFSGRQRYATSKLLNVMWTYALNRRLPDLKTKTGLSVVAFDPGLMPGTGLAREAGPFLRAIWMHLMPRIMPVLRLLVSPNVHTPKESGQNLARLAVGSDVKGVSGVYFEGPKEIPSSKDSYDETKQEDLWKWTIDNIGLTEKEKGSFSQ